MQERLSGHRAHLVDVLLGQSAGGARQKPGQVVERRLPVKIDPSLPVGSVLSIGISHGLSVSAVAVMSSAAGSSLTSSSKGEAIGLTALD
jgi:hypothetical protein